MNERYVRSNPLPAMLIGLVFFAVALYGSVWAYRVFTQYETEGWSVTIPYGLLVLYNLGGKGLVSGLCLMIFGAAGLLGLTEGFNSLVQGLGKKL